MAPSTKPNCLILFGIVHDSKIRWDGLGLAICKQLTELMEWNDWRDGEPVGKLFLVLRFGWKKRKYGSIVASPVDLHGVRVAYLPGDNQTNRMLLLHYAMRKSGA